MFTSSNSIILPGLIYYNWAVRVTNIVTRSLYRLEFTGF